MADWANRLDSFLKFNEYELLNNLGKVSREVADSLAISEYRKFRIEQDKQFQSDFDKQTQKYLKKWDFLFANSVVS